MGFRKLLNTLQLYPKLYNCKHLSGRRGHEIVKESMTTQKIKKSLVWRDICCLDCTLKSHVLWDDCSARCLEICILEGCSLELS